MGIKNWNAGIIRSIPVTPAGSYQTSSASGLWTMERVAFWKKQGLWPTAGNVDPSFYIENIFSTYLYTGTGATQTITNGIDLAGKGGLVWIKKRSSATGGSHVLVDTQRGGNKLLSTNTTNGEGTSSQVTFLSSGFDAIGPVDNAATYASWTFRKQAKFFDVVTYTGNGAASRNINHNLGSTPGCIICKATSISDNWGVYHRSTGANGLYLNATNSAGTTLVPTGHTSTTFEVANGYGIDNANGVTYVAYLFAHNAGGFGATGTDNVITCGSFTTDGSGNATVNLGYEPQWVMTKRTDAAGNWTIVDVMRGMTVNAGSTGNAGLYADSSGAEIAGITLSPLPNATGMTYSNVGPSRTFIYIAIRRGPMQTPTSGTSVFNTSLWIGNNSTQDITGLGFPADVFIGTPRNFQYGFFYDRLRGSNQFLRLNSTGTETTTSAGQDLTAFLQNGFSLGTPFQTALNNNATDAVMWNFRRAPGFLDVVCYTGTGSARTVTHNLGVTPELMVVKSRSSLDFTAVYNAYNGATQYMRLDATSASTGGGSSYWNNTTPTSSVFSVGSIGATNESSRLYVAYLFASCPGVSKVGSYTGTGTTQQINCGFTSGARFILIKRTDSTGAWYVWDTARGIVAGNDPYLLLNDTAAEVTNTDYIDSYSLGFEISSTAPAGINANGGTYIFLAIA